MYNFTCSYVKNYPGNSWKAAFLKLKEWSAVNFLYG